MQRRIRSIALVTVAIASSLGAGLARPGDVAATIGDQLRETGQTTYELVPARHVVHVTSTMTLTNKAPSTSRSHTCTQYFFDPYYGYVPYTTTCTTRTDYYYDSYTMWIEKDARALKVKADAGSASVKFGKLKGNYRQAVMRFTNLYYGRTRHLTLSYDLAGGGPRSTAARRAGFGYASFCASGPGTDTGSTRVIVPSGFAMTVTASMSMSTRNGKTIYSSSTMAKPWTFYACFTGPNDASDSTEAITSADGRSVTVESWRDDPTWLAAADHAVRAALPKLEALLGPLPVDHPLTIQEKPGLSGFDSYAESSGTLQLGEGMTSEDAMVDRLAQFWFNDDLFLSRWMRDGYAEWAVSVSGAGDPACTDPGPPPGTNGPNLVSAGDLPPFPTPEDRAIWAWDRQAGCFVIASIATAIGPERMNATLASLRGSGSAFASPVDGGRRNTSRSLQEWIDIIEQVGLVPAGADQDLAAHLALTYGATHDDQLLALHRAATTSYQALLTRLGDVPVPVRDALGAWTFDKATAAMAAAGLALDSAEAVAAALPALDGERVSVQATVRAAATQADLDAAAARGTTERALATDVATALALEATPRDPIEALGLLGATLPGDQSVIDAVARVDHDAATSQAAQISSMIAGARDAGMQRLALIVGSLVGLVLLLVILRVVIRRRRRPGGPRPVGPPIGPDGPDAGSDLAP
jgi:hypothetical protein